MRKKSKIINLTSNSHNERKHREKGPQKNQRNGIWLSVIDFVSSENEIRLNFSSLSSLRMMQKEHRTLLTLKLDLCLNLLRRSLRFPSVDDGLSLNLTEGVDLTLVHGNQSITARFGSSHYSLRLSCSLYHSLRLSLRGAFVGS